MLPINYMQRVDNVYGRYFFIFKTTPWREAAMLAASSMHSDTVCPVYIFLTEAFVKKSKNP